MEPKKSGLLGVRPYLRGVTARGGASKPRKGGSSVRILGLCNFLRQIWACFVTACAHGAVDYASLALTPVEFQDSPPFPVRLFPDGTSADAKLRPQSRPRLDARRI